MRVRAEAGGALLSTILVEVWLAVRQHERSVGMVPLANLNFPGSCHALST